MVNMAVYSGNIIEYEAVNQYVLGVVVLTTAIGEN